MMNQVQRTYAVAKAAYEAAKEVGDWELVDKLCTPLVEAEGALVEWSLKVAEESGLIPAAELAILKEKWMFPQYCERIVDLALRLNA